jgi:hypothetical protein
MQVMSNGRVRRSQAEWAEILKSYRTRGLEAEEFCRREQIHLGSFLRWQRRLGVAGALSDFVSMSPAASTRAPWTLEISFPNGCQLRIQG